MYIIEGNCKGVEHTHGISAWHVRFAGGSRSGVDCDVPHVDVPSIGISLPLRRLSSGNVSQLTPGNGFLASYLHQGFAQGGEPPVGVPSMVGENGPELFIPKSSGTVIPNNKLSEAMGGGTTNVTNNYINAIDTKSFEQRLLGSSTAVWAANQYGAKSLATTYGRT